MCPTTFLVLSAPPKSASRIGTPCPRTPYTSAAYAVPSASSTHPITMSPPRIVPDSAPTPMDMYPGPTRANHTARYSPSSAAPYASCKSGANSIMSGYLSRGGSGKVNCSSPSDSTGAYKTLLGSRSRSCSSHAASSRAVRRSNVARRVSTISTKSSRPKRLFSNQRRSAARVRASCSTMQVFKVSPTADPVTCSSSSMPTSASTDDTSSSYSSASNVAVSSPPTPATSANVVGTDSPIASRKAP
mmetsp:Transcript_5495/g.17803  ORF Transcript_5495/g.17803 Transcript_5495/m.17803 type:complete len:245 (-) Transcript_5495:2070-2804(-)